jgi:hypothetical protein
MRCDDRAIAGQAGGVVSKRQVRDLILTALKAYGNQQRAGMADEPFDVWRKAALHDACGRQSFRAVTQGEYGDVLGYFLQLQGVSARARKAAQQSKAADEAERARYALRRECESLADAFGSAAGAEAYADALLERIHKTDIEEASAKQLWQVVFTMRNRAKGKMRCKRA